MLVGEGELRVAQLAAQRLHAERRGLAGRALGRDGGAVGVLLHRVDLALDHRQAVLLAAHRGRVRLELALHRRHHGEVRVGLLRQPAHERLLHRAQPGFERVQPRAAGLELGLDELRRVLGADLARLAVLLDEHLRQAVDDPLRVFGRVVDEGDLVGVELRLLIRRERFLRAGAVRAGRGDRVGRRHADAAADAADRRLDRAVLIEVLEARGALEHRAAQQLLRHGAHPLLSIHFDGADQVRRQARGAHGDRRRRLIGARQLPDEQPADDQRERHRHDEPPLAAVEDGDVIERVETGSSITASS